MLQVRGRVGVMGVGGRLAPNELLQQKFWSRLSGASSRVNAICRDPPVAQVLPTTRVGEIERREDGKELEGFAARTIGTVARLQEEDKGGYKRRRSAHMQHIVRELASDQTRVYSKADKSSVIVVLDRSHYDDMCRAQLHNTQHYRRMGVLPEGSDERVARLLWATRRLKAVLRPRVGDLVRALFMTRQDPGPPMPTNVTAFLSRTGGRIPVFRGLPKTHKPGPLKIRPIVGQVNSPGYYPAKFIDFLLNPYVREERTVLTSTTDFINSVEGMPVRTIICS